MCHTVTSAILLNMCKTTGEIDINEERNKSWRLISVTYFVADERAKQKLCSSE